MIKQASGFRVLNYGFIFLSLMFKGLLVLAFCLTVAQAAPGDLDQSFGTGGKVVTPDFRPNPSASSRADAMVIQPDGKIVVTGTSNELAGINYRQSSFTSVQFGQSGDVAVPSARVP